MREKVLTLTLLVGLSCVPVGAEGDPSPVRAGFQSLQQLRPDKAIRHLTGPFIEALRAGDDSGKERAARYLMLIGIGFRTDDNIASYVNCAKQALLLAPNHPDVIAYNIEALLRASQMDTVKPLAERAGKLPVKNAYLTRCLSMHRQALGDRTAAEQLLDLSIRLDPTNPKSYIMKARFESNPEARASLYATAAKYNGDEPYVQQLLLWQSEQSLKTAQADTAHLMKAKAIFADDPIWKSSLAFVLLSKGQQQEAFDLMIAATQTPRLSLKAHSVLATYCAFNKRPELAMKAANRTIELAPDLPESYLARGHVYSALGDCPQAEKDFRKALSLAPHYNVAYQALSGLPQCQSGPQSEAIIQQWLVNCPRKIEPRMLAAHAAGTKRKWSASYVGYSKVCELFAQGQKPNLHSIAWCSALAGAGTAQYKLGNSQAAFEYAAKFNFQKPPPAEGLMRIRPGLIDLSKLPTGPKLESARHALLADMLYESNELDDCVLEYQRAIELDNNPEWHRGLLKAFIDKRDIAAATKENLIVSNDIVSKDLPGIVDGWRKKLMP